MALLATVVLLMTGCMSAQERALANAQADDATCKSYGLSFGSDGYAQCRQNVANQRAANARAALGAFATMQAAHPASQVPYYPMQVQQPVRLQTMCNTVGTTTFCN